MGGSFSRVAVQFDHFEPRKKLRIAMILCFVTVATILLAQYGPRHLRVLRYLRYIGYVLAIPTIFCIWSFVKTRGHRSPNQDINQAPVTSEQQYPPPSGPTDLPPPYPLPTGPQPSCDNQGTLNNTLPYPDQVRVAPYLPPPLNTNGSTDPLVAGQPPPLPAGAPPLYSSLPYPEQQGTEPHLPPPPSYDQAMQASQQS